MTTDSQIVPANDAGAEPLHALIAAHTAALIEFNDAAIADPAPEDETGNARWHQACYDEDAAFDAFARFPAQNIEQIQTKSAYVLERLRRGDTLEKPRIVALLASFLPQSL